MAYQRIRVLGRGHFGEVWLEEDQALDRRCAAKYLNVARLPSGTDPFAEAQQMLAAEHPHVVRVYSADEEGGVPVIRMEYLPDGSVADRYGSGPLRVGLALSILTDACRGVEYLHTRGLLHRDLKPGNLLVAADGRRCVSDFGLACPQNDPPSGLPLAYLPHLPPESLGSGIIEAVTGDLYALGVTLHRLLCGDAASMAPLQAGVALDPLVRTGSFPDRGLPGPHVHKAVRRALTKALHVDASKRYATARDLRHALEACLPVVSWGPAAGKPDAWEGEAMDGRAQWWAEIGRSKTGSWHLRVRRQLAGGQPRAHRVMDADAPSRAALEPLLADRLEAVALGA
jgi:serine/threonine protein kinase